MMPSAVSIAASRVGAAPVALQRRIEHVAQPVQDHRLAGLAQHAVVDAFVVGRALRHARQRAAGHHDQPPAELSRSPPSAPRRRGSRRRPTSRPPAPGGRCRSRWPGRRRARRARHRCERRISSSEVGQSSPMPRCAVSMASATPRPMRPQPVAVGDGGVPVDRALQPGVDGGPRIGHHVRGGVGDAVELGAAARRGVKSRGRAACRAAACRRRRSRAG